MKTVALILVLFSSPLFAVTISGGTSTSVPFGRISGGYGRSFWFSIVEPIATPRVTGSVSTQVPYRDRVYKQDSVATVTDYKMQISYDLDRPIPEAVSVSTSDPSIIALGADINSWTYQSSGTAIISATCASRSVSRTITTSGSTQAARSFYSYGANSVAANSTAFVDGALAGKTATSALALFSTRNDSTSTYVRNVGCWAYSVDFSCASVWNSAGGGLYCATLVSPRHVVFANHAPNMNGATLRFVSQSNVLATRTVTSTRYATSDITVGILDSDVPSGINYATVIPTSGTNKITPPTEVNNEWTVYPSRVPVVGFNQTKTAAVHDWIFDQTAAWGTNGWLTVVDLPSDAQRKAFNVALISGDSGCPVFLIVNGHAVLISLWWFAGAGPAYHVYNSQINSAMHALSVAASAVTDYQLTNEDLSGFTSY